MFRLTNLIQSRFGALLALALFGLSGGLLQASCTEPKCTMAKYFKGSGTQTINGLCYEFEYPYSFGPVLSSASDGGVQVCEYPDGSKWRSDTDAFCHNCTCPDHDPDGENASGDDDFETCLYTTQAQDDWRTTTYCNCQMAD